jgi:hypothetical protein
MMPIATTVAAFAEPADGAGIANIGVDVNSILKTVRSETAGVRASPTDSTVFVNGKAVPFEAYNIGDFNYFKLRDIAYAVNGTPKQFEVGWDGANDAISLTGGKPYTPAGGEMSGKSSGARTAAATGSKIYADGRELRLTAYAIDGYNYFKLREIGQAMDFGVDWDEARNAIVIDTGKGYSSETVSPNRDNIGRDYRSELVGYLWHGSDMLGSGWSERFLLAPDSRFFYAASQMDGETRTRGVSGTWEIDEGYLVLYFRQAIVWEGGETVPATGSTGTAREIVDAKTVEKTYNPAEKHKILIGNYIYIADMPHPWSVCCETSGPLCDGWWYRDGAPGDYDQLMEDWYDMLP